MRRIGLILVFTIAFAGSYSAAQDPPVREWPNIAEDEDFERTVGEVLLELQEPPYTYVGIDAFNLVVSVTAEILPLDADSELDGYVCYNLRDPWANTVYVHPESDIHFVLLYAAFHAHHYKNAGTLEPDEAEAEVTRQIRERWSFWAWDTYTIAPPPSVDCNDGIVQRDPPPVVVELPERVVNPPSEGVVEQPPQEAASTEPQTTTQTSQYGTFQTQSVPSEQTASTPQIIGSPFFQQTVLGVLNGLKDPPYSYAGVDAYALVISVIGEIREMQPDDPIWPITYGYICYNPGNTAANTIVLKADGSDLAFALVHEAFHAHLYQNGGPVLGEAAERAVDAAMAERWDFWNIVGRPIGDVPTAPCNTWLLEG